MCIVAEVDLHLRGRGAIEVARVDGADLFAPPGNTWRWPCAIYAEVANARVGSGTPTRFRAYCSAMLHSSVDRLNESIGSLRRFGQALKVACITRNQCESNASFNTFANLIPARYIRSLTTGMFLSWYSRPSSAPDLIRSPVPGST